MRRNTRLALAHRRGQAGRVVVDTSAVQMADGMGAFSAGSAGAGGPQVWVVCVSLLTGRPPRGQADDGPGQIGPAEWEVGAED